MNDPRAPALRERAPPPPFSADELAAARRQDEPLLVALEAASGLGAREFCARLGATVRLPVTGLAELQALTAGFEFIPFGEALQRGLSLIHI